MLPFVLVAIGALGIAVTTALEIVTAPYSPFVSAYPFDGWVHIVKVLALLLFSAGMAGLWLRFRDRLGVIGSVAVAALVLGPLAGALPYSIAESTLDPTMTPTRANVALEAIYAANPWIGTLANFALPAVVLGIIAFGIVALRQRLVPAWAPVMSLVMIPLAIGSLILAEGARLPAPHPPVWLFLGLAAYGVAGLMRDGIGRARPVAISGMDFAAGHAGEGPAAPPLPAGSARGGTHEG